MNSGFEIRSAPDGINGVQQSLREQLKIRISELIKHLPKDKIPGTIQVKLTGDGTQIARGLSVVNIKFTVLEEGMKAACSAYGNHSIAILKTSEKYEELRAGLEDICDEAKDLQVVTIDGHVFKIQFFLGGDMKFLAMNCCCYIRIFLCLV